MVHRAICGLRKEVDSTSKSVFSEAFWRWTPMVNGKEGFSAECQNVENLSARMCCLQCGEQKLIWTFFCNEHTRGYWAFIIFPSVPTLLSQVFWNNLFACLSSPLFSVSNQHFLSYYFWSHVAFRGSRNCFSVLSKKIDLNSGNNFCLNQNANSSFFRMFSSFNAYPLQYVWLYSFQSLRKIAFCLLNSGNIHTRIAFLLQVAPSLCKSLPGIYWQMCFIETWRHKKKYFFSN